MNQHRSLLASLFALVLGVALWGGGCASGGQTSASGGDDGGGGGDGTTPVTDASGEGGGCTGGKTKCGSTCTSTSTDPKNCGKCGTVCSSAQVCSQGACAAGCSGGETLCGGPAEAGAPASEAGASEGGAADTGTAPVVDSGTAAGDAGAPHCANLNSDPANCGGCGVSCGVNGTCTNGTCMLGTCPGGQKSCPASGTCIPNGTCCQSGECTLTGEVCPMPGGVCQCPSGEKACTGAIMACISNAGCCMDGDCANGGKCTTPGQACTCPISASLQCCQGSDCPAEPNVMTSACSTSASPPPNTCSVASCKAGCYDLNSKYSDGCECCDTIGVGHTCATATAAAATITPGSTTNFNGTIPEKTGGDWYTVTFADAPTTSTTFHAMVTLSANPSNEFIFDIVSGSCTGTPLTCGVETSGTSTADTTWETYYGLQSPAGDPTSYPVSGSHFQPIGSIGTVFIHVYRASTTAPATCDQYTLAVSE
jgi:hypothetical protein